MTVVAWAWLVAAALAPAAPAADPGDDGPPPADVRLDIDEDVVTWRVAGDDLEALRAALRDQAPAGQPGGSHGRTQSTIRIEYAPEPVPGGCRARDAAVRIRITTTLPEWRPAQPVPPGLAERWNAVVVALQRHEARHRRHALAAARELQARIATTGVQPDCAALRRAIDRDFMRVTLKAEFRDARYDERTRNGIEEGIAL